MRKPRRPGASACPGAEQLLPASEDRFRQFAENYSAIFWIVDARSGQFEYLNPAYETIMGESREAAMADPDHWLDLVHPDDREEARQTIPRSGSERMSTVEYRIIRPTDGATRWIRDAGFVIRDAAGEVARLAGVAQDVTEEKRHSDALAESEERFRLLVESTPDYAMFLIDPGNRIIYWSSGAERIFGWTADEALGKSGRLIFTPEDRARKQEEKELRGVLRKGYASDRRWHLRKDGSRVWIDGVMRRLDDDRGGLRGFAKIGRDATEKRMAEEKLQKSHADLENRVKERTADLTAMNRKLQAGIAQRAELEQEILLVSEREQRRIGQDLHDILCQELAAAAFFLQSAALKLKTKSPVAAKTLSEAANIVNQNVGLARDLARGLHPVEISASGLADALRELAYRCNHGAIKCTFECPRPVRVGDDAVALNLYRIAQEAVNNAIKNGKAKKIILSLARKGGQLILRVEDHGRGFSPARPTKGMGIHIMKYRADIIGATLELESREGHGTRITCILPARRPDGR